jgi:Domain of unknown function (DUF4331)
VRTLEHRKDKSDDGAIKHFAGEQTTRLGQPLINELFIGITYKNEWNGNHPSADERYNSFLLNPVLPIYIQLRYGAAGVIAPPFSRVDLLTVLHQGIPGLTQTFANNDDDDDDNDNTSSSSSSKKSRLSPKKSGHNDDDDDDDDSSDDDDNDTKKPIYADMLRMNINAAGYKSCQLQNPLGVVGGDTAGYPNGRRLGKNFVCNPTPLVLKSKFFKQYHHIFGVVVVVVIEYVFLF